MSTLDDFVALSESLTGVQPLDQQLAADYLARASSNPDVGGVLTDLIATFKDITAKGGGADVVNAAIGNRIMADGRLGPAAQQIIYLWYISAFFSLVIAKCVFLLSPDVICPGRKNKNGLRR